MSRSLDRADVVFEAKTLGSQTLVGYDRNQPRPSDDGNCFGVFVDENVTAEKICAGAVVEYKIVNFNVENLNALLDLGLTWPIRCMAIGLRTAIFHDPRIGERWYSNRYCEVCCPKALLPVTQLDAHDRDILRGHRIEHEQFTQFKIGAKAEFE
jgi:hypothetical protein